MRQALLLTFGLCGVATAQPARKVTLGIYAPSVEFGSPTARLAYVKGLASAIAQNAGVDVEPQSFANIGALARSKVDFAIVDGPCYATNLGWRLLASAKIGGATTLAWALFAGAGETMQSLRGKRLAYVQLGCNDAGFIDNAMLESEVDARFFGARVGKQDLTGAIAEVASYKTAQAVFAPVGAAKGLNKVYDVGAVVPTPAFVAISKGVPAGVADKVAAAVIAYGGGGAIAGWARPSRDLYTGFAARLRHVSKAPVMAVPETVRVDDRNVLIEPPTLRTPALVDPRHLYVRAPNTRLD